MLIKIIGKDTHMHTKRKRFFIVVATIFPRKRGNLKNEHLAAACNIKYSII